MNQKIRILLVDDQVLFREGLRTLLEVQDDFDVIGEASNGEEALRMAATLSPNVVLMDLRMPILDGVNATRRLHENLPTIKVIVLTTFDDDEDVFEGLRAGAVGYLLKDVSSEKLNEAIRSASRGEYFLPPAITAKVMAEFSRMPRISHSAMDNLPVALSTRELEVLRMVSTGASNKEIAEKLVIAEGTVKNHLTSILGKLEARDRMQAVLKARELGLI
ncbi:MAG TPA: response regulator transcription factor [Bellilinea sp.]|jgi:DNA-binding NarL/FixJ family response regulator|nr:response regulator transcription factor [Bellilinea sp.]